MRYAAIAGLAWLVNAAGLGAWALPVASTCAETPRPDPTVDTHFRLSNPQILINCGLVDVVSMFF